MPEAITRYAPQPQRHWLLRFSSPREITHRVVFLSVIVAMIALGAICFLEAANRIDKPFAGFFINRRLAVSALGMPEWSGIQAGMRAADIISRVGEIPIKSVDDLDKIINNSNVGTPLNYTLKREGQVLTITVPVMRFSTANFLATFGSTFLQGLIFLAIGTVVFVLKPDSTVSLLFFIASTLQGTSTFIDFAVSSSATPFSYLLIGCDTILPALMIHFSAYFPFRHKLVEDRPRLLLIPYVVSAFILVPLVTLYPGQLFYRAYFPLVFSFIYLAIFCFLWANIYAFFRSISSLAKQRARVVFWGALFAFPLPLLAALIANTGASTSDIPIFTNLTALPIIIFPIAIAYSITRHNLFDVDIYIKRAVGYGIMTAMLGGSYFAIQLLLKAMILSDTAEKISPAIFSLLVVIFFNPANRRIQGTIDLLFFRKKFDYKEAVISISDALSSVLDLEDIIEQITGAIRKEMFIDNAGVIVLDGQHKTHHGYFVEDRGKEEAQELRVDIGADDKAIELVTQQRRLLTRYDIVENPLYAEDRDVCLDRFTELGATMLIPMVYQDRVNAIVTVGHKKSGQFFSKEDVELLTTLASQGATSIENARMAEQMKREETVRTNLARYLSPQIVDGIVKSDMQVNLGGNRKVVTVLFSDIRDFTKITENQPAEQLVRMLNEYFTAMADGIFAQQGSLDKYIGDAIVAVFGSLIPLENPEDQAVKTAIDMMQRLEKLNKEWEARGDFSMHMGIGICTGEVFLGNIGSSERMEFTVIGDTVNMASRLSDKAKAGQIIIAESVRSHLSTAIHTEELPPVEVKGKKGLHQIHEVVYA